MAEVFDERHSNLLQRIMSLNCSDEFRKSNYYPAQYSDEQGIKRPMYEMTRDGFAVLGLESYEEGMSKNIEKYINAFSAMHNLRSEDITLNQDIRCNSQTSNQEWGQSLDEILDKLDIDFYAESSEYQSHLRLYSLNLNTTMLKECVRAWNKLQSAAISVLVGRGSNEEAQKLYEDYIHKRIEMELEDISSTLQTELMNPLNRGCPIALNT